MRTVYIPIFTTQLKSSKSIIHFTFHNTHFLLIYGLYSVSKFRLEHAKLYRSYRTFPPRSYSELYALIY